MHFRLALGIYAQGSSPRVQFNSMQFNSIQFNSIEFNSMQVKSRQGKPSQVNSIESIKKVLKIKFWTALWIHRLEGIHGAARHGSTSAMAPALASPPPPPPTSPLSLPPPPPSSPSPVIPCRSLSFLVVPCRFLFALGLFLRSAAERHSARHAGGHPGGHANVHAQGDSLFFPF